MENKLQVPSILESESVKDKKMEENRKMEYVRELKKVLKSKLKGKNIINVFNSRAVSLIRHSAGIVEWKRNELQERGRRTPVLLTMYKAMP